MQRPNNFITGHTPWLLYNGPTISLQVPSPDCGTTTQQFHQRPYPLIVVQRPNNFSTATSSNFGTTAQQYHYSPHPLIVVQQSNNFITGRNPWLWCNGPTISLQATTPDCCTTAQHFHYRPQPLIVVQRPNNFTLLSAFGTVSCLAHISAHIQFYTRKWLECIIKSWEKNFFKLCDLGKKRMFNYRWIIAIFWILPGFEKARIHERFDDNCPLSCVLTLNNAYTLVRNEPRWLVLIACSPYGPMKSAIVVPQLEANIENLWGLSKETI